MATVAGKRKLQSTLQANTIEDAEDLFVDAPPDGASDDDDTTDSEDSEYSGLEEEEEEDSDDEEEEESSEEESEEGESDDEDEDEEDDDEEDDEDEDEEALEKAAEKIAKQNAINNAKTQRKKKLVKDKSLLNNKDEPDAAETSSSVITEPGPSVPEVDEYEYDSSDEEDLRNTVGNIPMQWYNDYSHVGYTVDGKKIIKPEKADQLDEFINKMDNPDYWRTVKDRTTGQDVILSDADVELLQRIKKGYYADPNYNPYEEFDDLTSSEKMIHPINRAPRSKRSFIPSKSEAKKVSQMVHAIKMGWIKPKKKKEEGEEEQQYYDIWKDEDASEINRKYRFHIPAPKMALPGHAESYNPPPEYLFTEEEKLAWNAKDPEERRMDFIPQKFSCLRHVPGYSRFIMDRFERCLDLYLCPRQRRLRMNVNPEDLIPKLPKPKDLQPFPTTQSLVYTGHTGYIRCVRVDHTGQWLASGSDDGSVRVWEVATGRCVKVVELGDIVKSVEWNPNNAICLLAAVAGDTVYLINPEVGDKVVIAATDNMLSSFQAPEDAGSEGSKTASWHTVEGAEYDEGIRIKISHSKEISKVSWQIKGDYFATVMPKGDSKSIHIHQLSKRRSQNPFSKNKGLVQDVKFHPSRPYLFVATQRNVRVYNLLKQELSKKLMASCKWISSIDIHPKGDNVIVGSYDSKMSWFDMDLSTKPYQTLRHHNKAIRDVCFHKKYPLFASASDDGSVIVCHGMVYNDLLQNPLIVPVKILRGHGRTDGFGTMGCDFHPTQPWIFSSGSDATIRLFT